MPAKNFPAVPPAVLIPWIQQQSRSPIQRLTEVSWEPWVCLAHAIIQAPAIQKHVPAKGKHLGGEATSELCAGARALFASAEHVVVKWADVAAVTEGVSRGARAGYENEAFV